MDVIAAIATGTVPTGIALVRIVDPELSTTTAVELGAMNIPMMLSTAVVIPILAIAQGAIPLFPGVFLLLIPVPFIPLILKKCHALGKKTYDLDSQKAADAAQEVE